MWLCDIVFYNEDLPADYYKNYQKDFAGCDLLYILGTSMNVRPICQILSYVRSEVPIIYINNEWSEAFKGNEDCICFLNGDVQRFCEKIGKEFFF